MNPRLSVWTVLRSPLKTLVTFILLAATSFAFVSRGAEYELTESVLAAAEQRYSAVGTLVATEQRYKDFFAREPSGAGLPFGDSPMEALQYYCPIDAEAARLVSASGRVESCTVCPVAGGITEYPNVQDASVIDLHPDSAIVIAKSLTTYKGSNQSEIFYEVEEVLAGDSELYPPGRKPEFYVGEDGRQHPANGHTFYIVPRTSDIGVYEELIEGHRYVLALTPTGFRGADAVWITGPHHLNFMPDIPYRLLDLTLLEQEKGSVSPEDYAYMLQDRYGRITEVNAHKQDMVFTSDMSKLPRFHDGTLYISEGRMITPEDTGNVCVINAEYAARNGIKIGDTVDFTATPNTMAYGGRVISREIYDPNEFYLLGGEYTACNFEPVQMSCEVAGIWTEPPRDGGIEGMADTDALIFSPNTVFLQEAAYPWTDEVTPYCFPSTFSFALKSPGDVRGLELELSGRLEELGYRLAIDDMGYSGVEMTFRSMRTGAAVSFAAMSAALLLSLVLINYLFIVRRKGEYAIMRALGVPAGRAGRSLLAGLLPIAAAADAAGCAGGTMMLRGFAVKLAASIAEVSGGAASVSFSPRHAAVFGAGALFLLTAFASVGLHIIGKQSPLSLLQGGKK